MIGLVLRLVKREAGLARQHGDVLLLGRERPGKLLAPVGVEVHLDALGALERDEALGLKTARADDGRAGETGRGAEHAIEGYGGVRCADGEDDLCVCVWVRARATPRASLERYVWEVRERGGAPGGRRKEERTHALRLRYT